MFGVNNGERMSSRDPASGLSGDEEEQVLGAVLRELTERPPTIGLIGTSGVGKSSTINAMFRTSLPVSHVSACTKEFRDSDLAVRVQHGQAAGEEVRLRVVDAPGLGEDEALDEGYLREYERQLGRCDVILWVLAARNRAIALDQQYLRRLAPFAGRMIFGINQCDLVDPLDWSERLNLPSTAQEEHVAQILNDRREHLERTVGGPVRMVAYSASKGWNLQELFTTLVESAPPGRAWVFSGLKAFRPEDFLPEAVREEIWRRANAPSASGHGSPVPKKRRWFTFG